MILEKDEKATLNGTTHGYGQGIKGKDEKKQKKAFDKNREKAEKGDPSAYEPTAIDKKVMAKREKGDMPKAKKSQYTEADGPCWPGYKQVGMKDKTGKQVPNCVPAQTYKNLTTIEEDSDKALANKAKESGEPLGDLKKVYKQGLAAYASGHSQGMPHHQGAMARGTSYIKGGKAREVDAHIRKESKQSFSKFNAKIREEEQIDDAEYQGREVKLNKPMQGDVKKSKVYVKNEKGNVVKVNFGDPNMTIKKDDPGRRASFRARHNCDDPGPKTGARYWSCKAW